MPSTAFREEREVGLRLKVKRVPDLVARDLGVALDYRCAPSAVVGAPR
jgi:hypothetical protein